jgi:hypothetical protein
VPKLTPLRSFIGLAGPRARRVGIGASLATVLVLLFVGLAASPAYGDVGVLLNESLDTSVARITCISRAFARNRR